jgi:hypothetical protein
MGVLNRTREPATADDRTVVHDQSAQARRPPPRLAHDMFHVRGARGTLALNWGVAIIVYLGVAWLVTRILFVPWRAVRRRTVDYARPTA